METDKWQVEHKERVKCKLPFYYSNSNQLYQRGRVVAGVGGSLKYPYDSIT